MSRLNEIGEPTESAGEPGDGSTTGTTATIEDLLARGWTVAEQHPVLAVAGVVSVAALAVIALKPSRSESGGVRRANGQVDGSSAIEGRASDRIADALSGAILRVATAEHPLVAPYQQLATDFFGQMADAIGRSIGNSPRA